MPRDVKKEITVFILFFLISIVGIVYLVLGNSFSDTYVGILQKGSIFTDSSCSTRCYNNGKNCHTSCSNTYYIDEIFLKNNYTTSTCTVRRLTYYYSKKDADNFVSNMILNTSRQLYQTTYSSKICMDDKIKNYYNIVGGVIFFGSLSIMVISFCLIFVDKIRNYRRTEMGHTNIRDIEMGN